MLISYEHRFIHIAVPRTGSRCTHKFLRKACTPNTYESGIAPNQQRVNSGTFPQSGPHVGLDILRHHFPKAWESFRKLVNIRHPYTFCLSAFAWMQSDKGVQHERLASTPSVHADRRRLARAYAEFLEEGEQLMLWDEKKYFFLDNAPIDMHLVRYEDLRADLQQLSDQWALGLDVAQDLPQERDMHFRSPSSSAQWLGWTPHTLMNARAKALIDERYAWYFERFGYKKEIEDAA